MSCINIGDEVLLVLTKSQGSSMESMPDNVVDQMDAHNTFICEAMCKAYGTPMVERNVVHWISLPRSTCSYLW